MTRLLRRNTWMAWIEHIVVIFIISFAFYTTIPIKPTQALLVPQGSISNIITQLTKQGYALSIIDKYLLILIGKPQSGWVNIDQPQMNRIDFLYKLTKAKAKMEKVTLIPGETSVLFFENVAKTLHLNKTKLETFYKKYTSYPEAGIYADTYYVPHGISEKRLISFLLKESEKKYQKISIETLGSYHKKVWLKILIKASIIQKEAANAKEMPIVSSVIANRLKKGMKLQMDGTLNYGKYSHIKVTPTRIKTDSTRFNTYRYKGLPLSPIGSVSLDAIDAAIYPIKSNYLYFMKNAQGVHDFTDSFKKHRKNIKRAQ